MTAAMKPVIAALSIAATIIISTDRASGDFVDGNDLYEKCTDPTSQIGCINYVMGVLDAASGEALLQRVLSKQLQDRPDLPKATLMGFRWCPSEGVTLGQAVDAITNFLRDNLRDNPAYRDFNLNPAVEQRMFGLG
jgi:hypothetical protein